MLAVRPPEYLPRLAFFALARRVERFVLADTFQYSRQSFQNRARIVTPTGAMWLTVPLLGGQHGTPVNEIEIDWRTDWRRVHLKALRFNYGTAPFYAELAPRIEALLAQRHASLGALTRASVALMATWLGLEERFVSASEIAGAPATLEAVRAAFPVADLLALTDTAAHDGATPLSWDETPRRHAFAGPFRPDCSALDALMLYGPEARRWL